MKKILVNVEVNIDGCVCICVWHHQPSRRPVVVIVTYTSSPAHCSSFPLHYFQVSHSIDITFSPIFILIPFCNTDIMNLILDREHKGCHINKTHDILEHLILFVYANRKIGFIQK